MNEEKLFCKLFPDYAVNGKPLSPYFDFFESGYEQAENRIEKLEKVCQDLSDKFDYQVKQVMKLEKENANLKEELKNWKDEWQEQVQKATDEGYARTLQTIQLSKAKEIINKLIELVEFLNEDNVKEPIVAEAEKFLNSEVEK